MTATTQLTGTARPRHPGYELALAAALYLAYSLARQGLGDDGQAARENALALLRWERALALDVEQAASAWLADHLRLSVVASYLYALLHYTVTPAVLLWVYLAHPLRYVRARRVLALSTALALVGYWLVPTAPPRLVGAGYPDVLALTSGFGWWGAEGSVPRGLGDLTNQYAALPSMHVGWALWAAACVALLARRTPVRVLAACYPLLTCVVVVATGNHWLLDAAAGAAVIALAAAVVLALERGGARGARTGT